MTYPTDPYPPTDSSHWPDGPGQLTMDGKRRMLSFGRFSRTRFADFLSDSPLEAYVQSSPVERCLMSAELVMTGLYPATGRLVIEEGLEWQPVAINTPDSSGDRVLAGPHKISCPAGDAAVARNLRQLTSHYNLTQEDYQAIADGSGLAIHSPCQVLEVWDTINAAVYDDKPLPDWVSPALMARMEQISVICWEILQSGDTLPRLNAGVFLYEIQQFFATAAPVLVDGMPRKAFFYSSHDGRVVPLLYALGIHDNSISEYGVSLLFELLESPDGQLYVRTFFLPDVLKADQETMVPEITRGCPTDGDCTAEQFFAGLEAFILDAETHEKECQAVD